jgi:hypothetical protein
MDPESAVLVPESTETMRAGMRARERPVYSAPTPCTLAPLLIMAWLTMSLVS